MPVNKVDEADEWIGVERRIGHSVLIGGQWQPPHCKANTRLAVIIPYRDRESHLRIMLRHLYPILQRQLADFRIFVVEQVANCSVQLLSRRRWRIINRNVPSLLC